MRRRVQKPWTRKPKLSVIQRPQAVESPIQGHTPNRGRGRVALSTVILAKRGSPRQGHTPNRGRVRPAASSVILAQRGSPRQGQGSTLSFPRQNQPGDSRAERENDSNVLEPLSLPRQNQPGDSSVASGSL